MKIKEEKEIKQFNPTQTLSLKRQPCKFVYQEKCMTNEKLYSMHLFYKGKFISFSFLFKIVVINEGTEMMIV